MDDKQLQTMLDYLDKIGAKIGVTGQEVWPWAIRQQYINAITSALLFVAATVISVYASKWVWLHWDPPGDIYSLCENDIEMFACSFLLFLYITLGFTIADVFCYVPRLFNVKYWALKHLIGMAKQ